MGCAQTGTGKTAAFALPILQRFAQAKQRAAPHRPIALVLAPTRELAAQIRDSFRSYGRYLEFKTTAIFGGVGQQPQVHELARRVDILVATPGRLLDLMGQGYVRLDQVSVFVLDEADRMLDMGFINDIRKVIAALPKQRQTLMFSATMPPPIADLARTILVNPLTVTVTPVASTVAQIQEQVLFVDQKDKRRLLAAILKSDPQALSLVFVRTKHGADKVVRTLRDDGVAADAIHGNKSQGARQRALENFRAGRNRVLVATDIAARGIDVEGITHVVNYDLPNEPESYVHRIGRTARAGASGQAISFCSGDERPYLRDIEGLIRHRIPVGETARFGITNVPPPPPQIQPQHQMQRPQVAHQPQGQRRPFPQHGGRYGAPRRRSFGRR
jgi:ATP-dependent RNA helicase RhlE